MLLEIETMSTVTLLCDLPNVEVIWKMNSSLCTTTWNAQHTKSRSEWMLARYKFAQITDRLLLFLTLLYPSGMVLGYPLKASSPNPNFYTCFICYTFLNSPLLYPTLDSYILVISSLFPFFMRKEIGKNNTARPESLIFKTTKFKLQDWKILNILNSLNLSNIMKPQTMSYPLS